MSTPPRRARDPQAQPFRAEKLTFRICGPVDLDLGTHRARAAALLTMALPG